MIIKDKYMKEYPIYDRIDTYLQIPLIMFYYEEFSYTDILIYSTVYQFCKSDFLNNIIFNETCNVTNAVIADRSGVEQRTVTKTLAHLADLKIITIKKGNSKNRKIIINIDFISGDVNETGKDAILHRKKQYNERIEKMKKNKNLTYIVLPDSMRLYKDLSVYDTLIYSILYHLLTLEMKKQKEQNKQIKSITEVYAHYSLNALTNKIDGNLKTVRKSLNKLKELKIINYTQGNCKYYKISKDFFKPQPEEDNLGYNLRSPNTKNISIKFSDEFDFEDEFNEDDNIFNLKDYSANTDINTNLKEESNYKTQEEDLDEIIESFELKNWQ